MESSRTMQEHGKPFGGNFPPVVGKAAGTDLAERMFGCTGEVSPPSL